MFGIPVFSLGLPTLPTGKPIGYRLTCRLILFENLYLLGKQWLPRLTER
jgi:hypothetical protein